MKKKEKPEDNIVVSIWCVYKITQSEEAVVPASLRVHR